MRKKSIRVRSALGVLTVGQCSTFPHSINSSGLLQHWPDLSKFNPHVGETHVVWALQKLHMGLIWACLAGVPLDAVQFLILGSHLIQFFLRKIWDFCHFSDKIWSYHKSSLGISDTISVATKKKLKISGTNWDPFACAGLTGGRVIQENI